MSWLTQLANTVFPREQNNKQKLPLPPFIMAGGGPWYEEVAPTRKEIAAKIMKDLLYSNPELSSLNLSPIINEIIGDETFGSYRGYYTFQHNKFVDEAKDLALMRYVECQQNMKWFYNITRTKVLVHKYVKRFRQRHPKLILQTFLPNTS